MGQAVAEKAGLLLACEKARKNSRHETYPQ